MQNNAIPTDQDIRLGNLRSQIKNVNVALESITDHHAFVLRVRSDQICFKENFLERLITYNNLYNACKSKIIKLSMNSIYNRNFSTSDMFMFGSVKILRDYWDVNENKIMKAVNQLERHSNLVFPESILDACFFNENYGFFPVSTDDYLRLLKYNYIIIDESNIDVVWYKNPKIMTSNREQIEISHADWLKLFIDENI
jgi:hypothetical protein